MHKHLFLIFSIILTILGISVFYVAGSVSANPDLQVFYYTPTAQPDGRIVYTVKEGDSCISIALLNNISEDQLRLLNDLDGIEFLVGIHSPAGDDIFTAGDFHESIGFDPVGVVIPPEIIGLKSGAVFGG